MRVLFCSHPAVGHYFQLVQLAWAFRAAGHDVIVAIADYAETAAKAGLEVVDVAPDFDLPTIAERVNRDHPEMIEAMSRPLDNNVEAFAAGLAAVNRELMERTVALADDWRPDLVVYDQPTTVGLFVAGRLGVPAVQRNLGSNRTKKMHQAIAGYLADFVDRYEVALPEPAVTVELFPPSMLLFEPEGWFMRWVSYSGGGVLGDRLPQPPPDRPRVAVTFGTAELQALGVESLRPLVAAAGTVDAEFVLAVGDIDLGPLGALPPNVRPAGWTPMYALLRTCAGVVHHGGPATTMTALEVGIPQLVARNPMDPMQYGICQAIEASGIGFQQDRSTVDAELLGRLVSDPALRARTAEVRAEMLALPTPAATVARIERELG
jgi:UDP:flavonoid glycosyltransferase YjiC (YdhE family)